MKKLLLIAGLLLSTLTQAQITVTSGSNTITNGEELVFNTLGNNAKMQILVTNNTPETVYYRLQLVSVTNNTSGIAGKAGDIQLCFGALCYTDIGGGNYYPNYAVELTANGGHNDEADHFLNAYTGDATGDVVYNFRVVQVDANQAILNEVVAFSYRYSSTASTADLASLQKMGISLGSNIVTNALDITATQNAKLELFNINGQAVKTAAITSGSQSVDASVLAAGVYIARFTNEENKTSQIRIVKN
ncbi:T9SS type A sorting domain-containing protein [Flavobacterium sp.]|uniref:T9SS type A sorting domain-containing protein n=1 Tax=Flavobacterium sp. TaxID=239 RepID=UPI00403443D2